MIQIDNFCVWPRDMSDFITWLWENREHVTVMNWPADERKYHEAIENWRDHKRIRERPMTFDGIIFEREEDAVFAKMKYQTEPHAWRWQVEGWGMPNVYYPRPGEWDIVPKRET